MNSPGRPADLYVFAWHDESWDGYADHRDTNQWLFFVVAEQDLPKNRTIGLAGLKGIVSPRRIVDLKRAVKNACSAFPSRTQKNFSQAVRLGLDPHAV